MGVQDKSAAETPHTHTPEYPLRHNHRQQRLPAQLLEISSGLRQRHVLTTKEELRAELRAGQCSDRIKVLVIPSLDDETVEILETEAQVDPAFIQAHATRVPYRSRSSVRTSRWWSWIYPVMGKRRAMRIASNRGGRQRTEPPTFNLGRGCDGSVCLHRASLWLSGPVPVLILEPPSTRLNALPSPPPSLHYQKGVAEAPVSRSDGCSETHVLTEAEARTLGDSLLDQLQDDIAVEDAVGEVVHESWLSFVDSLSPRTNWEGRKDQGLLWMVLRALEYNMDVATFLARCGVTLTTVNHSDWTDLMDRIQRRVHLYSLCLSAATTPNRAMPPSEDSLPYARKGPNQRSLDRIAYLGGILLPITVVSSVLAIEGSYGPEGTSFWVFWASSAVISAIVLLVIYVDQVRSLQVWIEVAASEFFDSDDEDADGAGPGADEDEMRPLLVPVRRRATGAGADKQGQAYWVQRSDDGRTWQSRELGWGGAVKRICGYERWKGAGQPRMEAGELPR